MQDPEKLLKRHKELIHSEAKKVISHVQRESGDWIVNTLMLDGYSIPFKYKRKKKYRSLSGASVNLTYYASMESVAGIEFEVMRVVRIKRS